MSAFLLRTSRTLHAWRKCTNQYHIHPKSNIANCFFFSLFERFKNHCKIEDDFIYRSAFAFRPTRLFYFQKHVIVLRYYFCSKQNWIIIDFLSYKLLYLSLLPWTKSGHCHFRDCMETECIFRILEQLLTDFFVVQFFRAVNSYRQDKNTRP